MTIPGEKPAIDLNASDWKELQKILKSCIPEYEVWAFGSRVKGTAKRYSDLDLAIISEHTLPLARRAALRETLDESDLTIKVDVVEWASTNESFKRLILQDKVVVQKADSPL